MNILSIRLRHDIIAEARRQGLSIPVAFYTGDWHSPIDGTQAWACRETMQIDFPDSFAPDLPEAVLEETRRTGLTHYRRAYYRDFNRQFRHTASWIDVNYRFDNVVQYFWTLLRRERIDLVVFNDVPHMGNATVVYHLAHAMGLKVLILRQAFFPGNTWAAERIEDLAVAGFAAHQGSTIPVEETLRSPFYMKGKQAMTRGDYLGRMLRHGVGLVASTLILEFLWHRRGYEKSHIRLNETRQRYHHQRRFDAASISPDPDAKYIYFALHYQPEMNTDIQGGDYVDQVLAIEKLARSIDDDTLIYVKENPIQGGYMRDASFYTRLLAIPQVRLMPMDSSTFDLLRHARVVSTITGTVGWEAVQVGKPVICFGLTWYRGLPGVFEWRDDAGIVAKALGYEQDRAAFLAGVEDLSTRLWKGGIQQISVEQMEASDRARNPEVIVSNIREIIARMTPDQ